MANEGNQGMGLPPPKEVLSYASCNEKLYMEGDFIDAVMKETFKKWLTKKESIQVFIDVVCASHAVKSRF